MQDSFSTEAASLVRLEVNPFPLLQELYPKNAVEWKHPQICDLFSLLLVMGQPWALSIIRLLKPVVSCLCDPSPVGNTVLRKQWRKTSFPAIEELNRSQPLCMTGLGAHKIPDFPRFFFLSLSFLTLPVFFFMEC